METRFKELEFKLTETQIQKLEKLCNIKRWRNEQEWIREHMCPICENVLGAGGEHLHGIHKRCIPVLEDRVNL